MSIIYQGRRVPSIIVLAINDETNKARTLNPGRSRCVCDHSTEFNWSYGGSGPSQLALALLIDAIETSPPEQRPGTEDADTLAKRWYQQFKLDHVSQWNDDTFRIERNEIMGWLRMTVAQAQTKRQVYNHEPQFPKDPSAKIA